MAGKIIKTDFKKELSRLGNIYKNMPNEVIRPAGRSAVNRGLSYLKTQAAKSFKREVNLKSKEIKEDFFRTFKARRGEMTSSLLIKNKKLSLIRFVTSPKSRQPPNQKGVKVNSRRKIKVRVNPKRTRTLDHSFMATLRGDNVHVVNRRRDTGLPIFRLGGIRPALLFEKSSFVEPLIKGASVRTRVVFSNRIQFFYRSYLRKNLSKNLRAL